MELIKQQLDYKQKTARESCWLEGELLSELLDVLLCLARVIKNVESKQVRRMKTHNGRVTAGV